MIDHEDAYYDDQLSAGKGLITGLVLGSLIWAAIIAGAIYVFS